MIAAAVAAVALACGPVVESVTQRGVISSFRRTSSVRAFVVLRNGARIDAGAAVDLVVRFDPTDAGNALQVHALTVGVAPREERFSYETVDGRVRDHFRVTCSTATLPRPRSTP